MPAEGKSQLGPLLYFWLAVSTLLNVSGMASIVDGFVAWAGFLRDFIDLYRVWVREPLLWAAHLVWPAGWPRIAGWVADWLCINGSFVIAVNYLTFREDGETWSGGSLATIRSGYIVLGTFALVVPFVFGPLFPLLLAAMNRKGRELFWDMRGSYIYWLFLLGIVVLLMFLNWQLKRAGVW